MKYNFLPNSSTKHYFLGDLIHLVGYIKPTKRPPYNPNVYNSNPYKPYRPQRPPDYGYETNLIGDGPSYSTNSNNNNNNHHNYDNRPTLYDENGYGVTQSAVYSNHNNNRPLYAERPDPVYHDNPIYSRPTNSHNSNTNHPNYGNPYSDDGFEEGYQRSK